MSVIKRLKMTGSSMRRLLFLERWNQTVRKTERVIYLEVLRAFQLMEYD